MTHLKAHLMGDMSEFCVVLGARTCCDPKVLLSLAPGDHT
jgi:hypothetical protein